MTKRAQAIADGKQYSKVNTLNNETKIKILKANQHSYTVMTIYRCLGISRHYIYYQNKATKQKTIAEYAINKILTILTAAIKRIRADGFVLPNNRQASVFPAVRLPE
jgi:type I site-specific restriction-modification system R (restriction) subunit